MFSILLSQFATMEVKYCFVILVIFVTGTCEYQKLASKISNLEFQAPLGVKVEDGRETMAAATNKEVTNKETITMAVAINKETMAFNKVSLEILTNPDQHSRICGV